MGAQQPYMYDSDHRDSRSPQKEFDPKAVTRASWEVKPKKPKRNGPLVSFNKHPDFQGMLTGRTHNFRPMSDTTKWWIRWTRYMQLGLRSLELVTSAGLLVLMILISNVSPLVAWILRIAPGIIIICCAYAILHLSRPARARPPASSAAYQLFAGITDLAVLPFYAFGAVTTFRDGSSWETILKNSTSLPIFIKIEYYGLISASALHALSFGISLYLGLMFKRIADMPPDMNPLESNLTSRQHKRNKSSVASDYTLVSESTKRLSTPLEGHHPSGAAYEDLSRPPSVPFMHTRSGSRDSFTSSKRDSRGDLPSRQYQITPGNSPRNSHMGSPADQKRLSHDKSAQAGSYVRVPRHETDSPSSSRPGSAVVDTQAKTSSPMRVAKFTEAWYASESLINRTQKRQRAMNASERAAAQRTKAYEALTQRYGDGDSESDLENVMQPEDISDLEDDDGPINVTDKLRPDPLRLNPTSSQQANGSGLRQNARHSHPALTEISMNRRSVSGSEDIADAKPAQAPARRPTILETWGRAKGSRNFSFQRDDQFYSKPYGELRSATPPIMYGGEQKGRKGAEGRQVSSGNDYDLSSTANLGYRRKASGRAAEEGMAGPAARHLQYDVLDE
ncbi:hypothetical protein F4861DRAFT_146598 [Xylaria intraflava]|nr:hypothetical protein F4861DRAFT_146598 [Xylaria intraflava]